VGFPLKSFNRRDMLGRGERLGWDVFLFFWGGVEGERIGCFPGGLRKIYSYSYGIYGPEATQQNHHSRYEY